MLRALLVVVLVASIACGAAIAVVPGKVVARKSTSGGSAVAGATASIKKPRAIWVRFIGKVNEGTVIVRCSKDLKVSSNSYHDNAAGLYKIPVKPPRADTCRVVATIIGSGRIVAEIRASR